MVIDVLKPIAWFLTLRYGMECDLHIHHISLMVIAFSTILGSSSSKWWVLLKYWTLCHFTTEINLSYFFKTWWTHQLNLVCVECPGYGILVTWIWCDSLRLDNFSPNVEPSFHLQQIFQPAVDFLRAYHTLTSIIWFSILRAELFFLWLMNTSNEKYSFLSTSQWAYIDSAMMFAANSVISPPGNSTS